MLIGTPFPPTTAPSTQDEHPRLRAHIVAVLPHPLDEANDTEEVQRHGEVEVVERVEEAAAGAHGASRRRSGAYLMRENMQYGCWTADKRKQPPDDERHSRTNNREPEILFR